jgi:hypothetical protein
MLTLTLLLLAAEPKTTAADVKKEAGETADAAKRYANEKKDEFEARIDAKLKALHDGVMQVKEKTKNDADATVKDLEAKQKKAEAKAAEIKKASSKAWSSLKGGVETAVDDLEKGVEGAKAR